MATQSNYKYNSPANRKQVVNYLNDQTKFWHNYTDKCWYDDGYDEDDVHTIVASLKMAVDQGTSTLLRDCIKSGSSPEDTRHMKVPKWIPFEPKEPKVTKAVVRERYINMPDVNRVMPKIEPPKPKPVPKRYTMEEDCQEVEKWFSFMESIDNMEIIRTPESVRNIAKWIREDEHANYRCKQPISYGQVQTILKEFEK
jgi:hypothetical protein